ncbi:MAG: ATP-dependent RNA helicase [bacterium]|nr:ATP-dependent RNA helicase [bacterium]
MDLPIFASRDEIIKLLLEHQVVIVVGETGSGKTTQTPLFLYEAGFANGKKIGVTEPRKIAAISVAAFVAKQLGTQLGDLVGYQIRFDDMTADRTKIKFMTDGILLRELQIDPDLTKYSVIMIDEAHERSKNIDFTLGLLKETLKRRKDFKVVVASATIDQKKFSRYFDNAPVVNVSGRTFPVDILYDERDYDPMNVIDAVVNKVGSIHCSGGHGDILVFMTGEDEIRKVITGIEKLELSGLVPLPCYGTLSPEDQQKIFDVYPGERKVVVATNIAETSITVEGVVYVVDGGFVKQLNFHPEIGIESLDVEEHSQAGCNQRAGRAGRTQAGVCYRMFTEENFSNRPKFTEPEIRRSNLSGVVLMMEDIGIEKVIEFDFVDPPELNAFREAYETLIALGAIERDKKGLTEIGKAMAGLPLEPRISRMVLEAEKHNCMSSVVTIASFLSVRNVFNRPKGKEMEADRAHQAFKDKRSDLLTYLNIWHEYAESRFSMGWCHENFLNGKSLKEVESIQRQLFDILRRRGIEISQNGSDEDVLKAVTAGLIFNLFQEDGGHSYSAVLRICPGVYIHPSSTLINANPKWMVVTNITATTKVFARGCSNVNAGWLVELLPRFFTFRGDWEIVDFDANGNGVEIKREVVYKNEAHAGYARKIVSLEEADAIQQRKIFEAELSGWIRLSFTENEESFSSRYVTEYRGQKIRATRFHGIEEGVPYYCKLLPYSMIFDSGTNMTRADVEFKVFNFFPVVLPEPEVQEEVVDILVEVIPESVSKPEAPQQVSETTFADLAAQWGIKAGKLKK